MSGHTPGPWDYIPSTAHHGPYVAGPYGDVADCYTMTNPTAHSVANGGDSQPHHFSGPDADANARLIAAAPDLLWMLKDILAAHEKHPGQVKGGAQLTPIFEINVRAAIAKAEGDA